MTKIHTIRQFLCGSLIVSLASVSAQGQSGAEENLPIFMFDGSTSAQGWQIINDRVMGGRSDSSINTKPNGSLVFKGSVSLKNNGGFASTRSPDIQKAIGSFDGVELVVIGDGNKYKCGIRTGKNNSTDHQKTFETLAGQEQRIRIPYSEFVPTWRGRRLSEDKRLNPDEIRTIGFLIADKQEGAFELQVKYIGAYRDDVAETTSDASDIISIAQKAGVFKILLAAVDAAGLTDAVRSLEGVTLFAPTDEAFAKLPDGTIDFLLQPENKGTLVNMLTYHVIDSEVSFSTATTLASATALNGDELSIRLEKGRLVLNDSNVIENDIRTDNGIIHVIDSVLLPPETNDPERSPVESIIGSAIRRGVPLFNEGNPQACADLYELAAEALLLLPEENLSSNQREILTNALERTKKQSSASNRAWTMRNALDKTLDHSE